MTAKWFDGIEASIDGVEYAVGEAKFDLSEEEANDLITSTITLFHQHFEKQLDYIRVVFDDIEYGLSDRCILTGERIDELSQHVRNFIHHERTRDTSGDA